MINREIYETFNNNAATSNIQANAYRIHDRLEAQVRLLGQGDFISRESPSVSVVEYLTEPATVAANEVLSQILASSNWTFTYEQVPTDKVKDGLIVNKVTYTMSK